MDMYRRVQLARYLLVYGLTRLEQMSFDGAGRIVGFGVEPAMLEKFVSEATPFQTSGCPDCNRPFYNEKPGGPMYNYPRKISPRELGEIKRQLNF